MRFLGIDPSLTATGWAIATAHSTSLPGRWTPHTIWRCGTIKTKPTRTHMATLRRFHDINAALTAEIGREPVDLAVIEGPAFSKNNGMAHERAGLWWSLYRALAVAGIPTLVIKPNLRIKYATGRGNAGKDEVMLAASKRYPAATITNNNEADAVVLAAMGARWLDRPIDEMPALHITALKTLPETAAVM